MRQLHPQLREALAGMRAAGEANWYVLAAYILHANTRGRAWPSLDTLCRETGYGRPAVIAARRWLIGAGALRKVSPALRIDEERTHPRKEVMQITGVIACDDHVLRVLDEIPAGASLPIEGQAGLPIAGQSAPGITPEGHPGIPEGAATTAAALALLADRPEVAAVALVWAQEARQPLTPLLADILGELVERWGADQTVEAVREAVRTVGPGKFSVKYVIRVLERWEVEGNLTPRGESEGYANRRGRRRGEAGKKGEPEQEIDFSFGRTLT